MTNCIKYATQLENDAVSLIIKKYAVKYEAQLNNIYVSKRISTGVGMYVYFKRIDSTIEPIDKENPKLESIYGDIEGLKYGAGFMLYFENGNIDMLEMFSHVEGKWPHVVNNFTLEKLN